MATFVYKPGKAPPKASIAERLEARSIPEPNSGCVLWFGANGGNANSRHGCLNIKGERWKVHRLAWIEAFGPIPEGMEVCHKCDVPECINPAHLFLGTHTDNMRDMYAKGRRKTATGEMYSNAKLTAEKVRAIRADRRRVKDICAEYGIGKSTVFYIRAGQTWKHLP